MRIINKIFMQISEVFKTQKNLADAALTLSVRVFAAVLAYGVQIFLARTLMLEEYGIYVTLWTWLIIINQVAVFGFSESSLRFIPRYCERKQYQWAIGFMKTGFWFSTLGASIIGLGGFFGLWIFADAIPSNYLLPLMVLSLGLPIMALELYFEGISRSFGWYLLTIIPSYVIRPLLIAAGIFLAFVLGYTPDAAMVLGIAVVVTAGIVMIQSIIIWSRLKKQFGNISGAKSKKFWVTSSLPLMLATGIDELYIYSDIIILAFMLQAPDVAIYFAAQRTMSLAAFIQYAFTMVSVRGFSLANAMRDRPELQKRITNATSWTFWMTVPAVTITLIAGYPLLRMFGSEFVEGYSVMLVLGLGFLIRASVGQAVDLLIVMGHQVANIFISVGGLAFNIILSIILIPQFGILGAAIATTITFTLRAIVLLILTKKLTGLWVLTSGTAELQSATKKNISVNNQDGK